MMHDDPDFHPRVSPGVTRWAPGTDYGVISWSGNVAALGNQYITYAFPSNGYYYVLDKVFIYTEIVGLVPMSLEYCNDAGAPAWVVLATKKGNPTDEFIPFTFVSMNLCYPNALRWNIVNMNNVIRAAYMFATLYRYLGV